VPIQERLRAKAVSQLVEKNRSRTAGIELLEPAVLRPRQVPRRQAPSVCFRAGKMGPELGPSGDPEDELAVRKLRGVNECVDGYEPGGRTFESCRARQSLSSQPLTASMFCATISMTFWSAHPT
jgi:hypothetical protein